MHTSPLGLEDFDPLKARDDFPIFKRLIHGRPLVYLDSAATAQRPELVINAVKEFYEKHNSNIHRAVHTLSYEATLMYEAAHKKVARFIGARSWREIVFTRNATEAINLVVYAWATRTLKPGDEVLLSVMEHHSNIVPWQMLRDTNGAVLKFIDLDDDGNLRLDELPKLLTEKTKVVGIVHASNVLGVVNPVKEIIREAKRVGAKVLVDAAQSLPHLPIDVIDLDCDFLVGSGHKMLGPTGTGFLYAREEILREMYPFLYGGDMIETVTLEGSTWNDLPWKFEAGTPNIAGGVGLGAAVDYLSRFSMERLYEHERELLRYALERLSDLPWVKLYGPSNSERVGVVTFNVEGVHPHDVAGVLDEDGVAVRSGHHCAQPLMRRLGMEGAVRASFYLYNTKEDIDRLVTGVIRARELFGK
ncbi:MAG: cysteine desulfurase [Candidatus Caldarchaeum sp.]